MSGVGGVSGAGPVGGMQDLGPVGLTADTLMMYCASRLGDVDSQITAQMKQQQQAHGAQEKLNEAKRALLEPNQNDPATKAHVMTALRDAWKALPEGDPQRDQINELLCDYLRTVSYNNSNDERINDKAVDVPGGKECYNAWTLDDAAISNLAKRVSTGTGTNDLDKEEVKKYEEQLDGMLTDISKGAELKMINLQSLISQRQLVIQSTTQMLSKVSEGLSAIVGNFKS